jgi:hypothetical protein
MSPEEAAKQLWDRPLVDVDGEVVAHVINAERDAYSGGIVAYLEDTVRSQSVTFRINRDVFEEAIAPLDGGADLVRAVGRLYEIERSASAPGGVDYGNIYAVDDPPGQTRGAAVPPGPQDPDLDL